MNSSITTSPDYTQAPWYVSESLKRGFNVRSARGGFLAWVGTGSARRDAANAQLMAAAPRLLDYCKELLGDVSRVVEHPDIGRIWDWRLTERQLKAIIAEAEGQTAFVDRRAVAAIAA